MTTEKKKVRGVRALPAGNHVIAREALGTDIPAIWALSRPIYDEPEFNDASKGYWLWRVGRFYDRFPYMAQDEFWGADPDRRFGVVLESRRTGRIVGVGLVVKGEDDHTGEFSSIYLAPEYRKLGYGKWIVLVLLREAERLGYTRLTLTTRSEWTAAVSLYKSIGFRQVPNRKYPGCKNSLAFER